MSRISGERQGNAGAIHRLTHSAAFGSGDVHQPEHPLNTRRLRQRRREATRIERLHGEGPETRPIALIVRSAVAARSDPIRDAGLYSLLPLLTSPQDNRERSDCVQPSAATVRLAPCARRLDRLAVTGPTKRGSPLRSSPKISRTPSSAGTRRSATGPASSAKLSKRRAKGSRTSIGRPASSRPVVVAHPARDAESEARDRLAFPDSVANRAEQALRQLLRAVGGDLPGAMLQGRVGEAEQEGPSCSREDRCLAGRAASASPPRP